MAKLYFKYGAMGSSKSAQALITKFNYEELGMSVWLIKPSVDTRDGADIIRSRIGLEARAQVITPEMDITAEYAAAGRHDVIIADEAIITSGADCGTSMFWLFCIYASVMYGMSRNERTR